MASQAARDGDKVVEKGKATGTAAPSAPWRISPEDLAKIQGLTPRNLVIIVANPEIITGMSTRLIACLQTGKLALLAILVASGIVLQFLACAVYNNWWPMLTVIMYVILPMPLMFFASSDSSSIMSGDSDSWVDFTKFLTGASVVGSIAIPSILKHAGVICLGALMMELSSFFIFGTAILLYLVMNREDEYSML